MLVPYLIPEDKVSQGFTRSCRIPKLIEIVLFSFVLFCVTVKVISLLLTEICDTHVFNPPANVEEDPDDDSGGYEGATVIDTVKGFYGGPLEQVILLDFASLYPSIQRAYDISPDRIVRSDHPEEVAASKLSGVKITEHQVSATQIVRLATPYPDSGKPYFRRTLEKLLSERATVRKMEETETDPAKRAILNARQLSKKVACNSAYGLLGAKQGYLSLPDLAAVTTYQGRQALQFSKGMAEKKYGCCTIAGDSVAAYTPVYLKLNGLLHITEVQHVSDIVTNSGWVTDNSGKQICIMPEDTVFTWSDRGWTALQSIVRHCIDKKMYRVITASGLVDVTEDHSLLTAQGTAVHTNAVQIGDHLLHSRLPPAQYTDTSDVMNSTTAILNSSAEVRRAYLKGIMAADDNTCDLIGNAHAQLKAAQCVWLFHSLTRGVKFTMNGDHLKLRFPAGPRSDLDTRVLRIQPISSSSDQYVYDLTTENHHFAAGVGHMIVHNTDSIMITLPAQPGVPTPDKPDHAWKAARMQYVFEHGEAIGNDISAQLPDELVFELEGTCSMVFAPYGARSAPNILCRQCVLTGVMWPVCFYKKKNYAAVLWTKPDKPKPAMKLRGVCAVRNDWSLLCKNAATTVLRLGIQENNPEGAISYLQELVRKMLDHELPMSDFVISKQLKSLTPKTVSPHVSLCLRLQKIDPMLVPTLGSKIEFVIVKGYKELSDATRRPQDVTVQDLDLEYYFERQLIKPLVELVGPLIRGGQQTLRRLLTNQRHAQSTIYDTWDISPPAEEVTPQIAPKSKRKKPVEVRSVATMFGGGKAKEESSESATETATEGRASLAPNKKVKVKPLKTKDIATFFGTKA